MTRRYVARRTHTSAVKKSHARGTGKVRGFRYKHASARPECKLHAILSLRRMTRRIRSHALRIGPVSSPDHSTAPSLITCRPVSYPCRVRRTWFAVGAFFLAAAVGAGALGAHALRSRLDAPSLALWETAVRYLALGGTALLVLGLARQADPGRTWTLAGASLSSGVSLRPVS